MTGAIIDIVATEDLVRTFRPALMSYALRMTGSLHEAEDVVQQVFLRVVQTSPSPEDWRTFLYRMTHNAIVDRRRQQGVWARVRAVLGSGSMRPAPDEDPRSTAALKALESLDEPYRSTLMLRFLQHLKLSEIAEVKEAPLGTVKAQLARGLKLLKEKFPGGEI